MKAKLTHEHENLKKLVAEIKTNPGDPREDFVRLQFALNGKNNTGFVTTTPRITRLANASLALFALEEAGMAVFAYLTQNYGLGIFESGMTLATILGMAKMAKAQANAKVEEEATELLKKLQSQAYIAFDQEVAQIELQRQ